MFRTLARVAAILSLSACTAHSPMILRNTVDVTPAAGASAAAPHSRKVWVTEGGLPAPVKYEALGTLDAGTIWYSGADKVSQQMADRARTMGADAVINVRRWRQPSGFAWSAPHGSGQAVKILNPGAAKLDALPGGWF